MKLLPALAIFVLLASCKPKPGGSCKVDTKEVCVDEKHALACHDGKWEEMACRGESGCSKASGEHICDQSVAEDKDVCNLNDDYVCTADKKAMLQCAKGKWALSQTCLGDRGCVMEKKRVTCDNSVAALGDSCREEDDYACTSDKKTALVCRSGKFVVANVCKGPDGCKVLPGPPPKVKCDDTVAVAGDTCEKEDHYSCSSDEKAILRCHGRKFEVEEKCKGRDKCQVKGGTVGCF
jgi:hypothetical protein